MDGKKYTALKDKVETYIKQYEGPTGSSTPAQKEQDEESKAQNENDEEERALKA